MALATRPPVHLIALRQGAAAGRASLMPTGSKKTNAAPEKEAPRPTVYVRDFRGPPNSSANGATALFHCPIYLASPLKGWKVVRGVLLGLQHASVTTAGLPAAIQTELLLCFTAQKFRLPLKGVERLPQCPQRPAAASKQRGAVTLHARCTWPGHLSWSSDARLFRSPLRARMRQGWGKRT